MWESAVSQGFARVGIAACCCAAVLAFVCMPASAFGLEASSVVTVQGSVSSVTGQVSLDATTIAAIGAAVSSRIASQSVPTSSVPWPVVVTASASDTTVVLGLCLLAFASFVGLGMKAVGRP